MNNAKDETANLLHRVAAGLARLHRINSRRSDVLDMVSPHYEDLKELLHLVDVEDLNRAMDCHGLVIVQNGNTISVAEDYHTIDLRYADEIEWSTGRRPEIPNRDFC